MPVAALVKAGGLFGLAEGSLRVALTRLAADGRVERDERGSYRLGAAAAPVQGVVGGWRTLDRRLRPWRGPWWAVQRPERALRGAAGRRAAQALRLHGFASLRAGLWVRPANWREPLDTLRERLHAIGLPDDAWVFEVRDFDTATDARARALWDGAALVADYRRATQALRTSAAKLPELDTGVAMRESFLLGGSVVQQLVLDPWLPAPLVDEDERQTLLETMREYDRLGRSAWADFLGRFGVPHRTAPADTRWAAAGAWPETAEHLGGNP